MKFAKANVDERQRRNSQGCIISIEKASHVSMSAVKLISRVVGPISKRRQGVGSGSDDDISTEFMAGENSYGITSDPLTQFTVVLATVIHDCDHRGVSNQVLEREEPSLATMYKKRSISEQNALDVAWRTLMGREFRELRRAIYTTPAELRRFRQILVNVVMATDLFDEEMAAEREERWGTAFVPSGMRDSTASSAVSVRDSMASTVTVHYFRANVVLEYLIQASDVAHAMQHWVSSRCVSFCWSYWLRQVLTKVPERFCSKRLSTRSGMASYFKRVTRRGRRVVSIPTLPTFGISRNLTFLTATSSHWRSVSKRVVLLVCRETNTSTMRKRIVWNGKPRGAMWYRA